MSIASASPSPLGAFGNDGLPPGAAAPFSPSPPFVPMERTPRVPPTARAPPPPPKDKPVRKAAPPPPPPRRVRQVLPAVDTASKPVAGPASEPAAPPTAHPAEAAIRTPASPPKPLPTAPLPFDCDDDPFADTSPPLVRPQPVLARRGRPSPISVAVANAPRPASGPPSTTATPPKITPTPAPPAATPAQDAPEAPDAPDAPCAGFILAPASTDPFALAPCPRPAVAPAALCFTCAANAERHAAAETVFAPRYCVAHWCGGCKRLARRLAATQ